MKIKKYFKKSWSEGRCLWFCVRAVAIAVHALIQSTFSLLFLGFHIELTGRSGNPNSLENQASARSHSTL